MKFVLVWRGEITPEICPCSLVDHPRPSSFEVKKE